jgi:LPS O-antigen subunit length determinant protein (WzzB/FepE family)
MMWVILAAIGGAVVGVFLVWLSVVTTKTYF